MNVFDQLPLFQPTSPWRVSPITPSRGEGFDYERCAALHNEIVELGWTGSGKPLDELHQGWKSWFDYHGEAAEQVRDRMSDELVVFFEQARVIETDTEYRSFFFYVGHLSHPGQLWGDGLEESYDWEEPDRYLKLYSGNDLAASHNDGLIFDQMAHDAILQVDILASRTTLNNRQAWYPLEVVLSAWLDMIDRGKIQALPSDDFSAIPYHEWDFRPWVCHRWTQQGLEETVGVFNQLVDAIESKMPNSQALGELPPVCSVSQMVTSETLLSEVDVDAANIPAGFARSFLTTAKRPRFRYIAPGLAVPDPTSFSEQPFAAEGVQVDGQGEPMPGQIYSIQLFRSSELFYPDPERIEYHPFRLPSFPAGLYFNWCDTLHLGQIFEDEVKLYLPFGIGANGYARTSDAGLFGEDKERDYEPTGEDRAMSLYQSGYRPFTDMHDVTLVEVLRSWLGMVERGDWRVGTEGVEGSIEMFKEADTEEGWEKFIIPVSW